jgi:hypothetical protein
MNLQLDDPAWVENLLPDYSVYEIRDPVQPPDCLSKVRIRALSARPIGRRRRVSRKIESRIRTTIVFRI